MREKEQVHGGNVEQFAREYGFSHTEVLDYSSNINPLSLPEEALEQVRLHWDDVRRYPDREYLELRNALGGYTGCSPDWIMPGNGATELIYLVARSLGVKKVLLPAPSFADYQRAFHGQDCQIDLYRIKEELDFRLDIEPLLATIKQGYDMLILCNPNNPSGYLIPQEDMLRILEQTSSLGVLVLLDETFMEFAPYGANASMLPAVKSYRNIILLKALTKFFAVPGLRLGYCLAHPLLLERMKPYKEPWTVNALACAIGTYLLTCDDFIEETRTWIEKERPYLYKGLSSLRGLKTYESAANFFLLKLMKEGWNVELLQSRLVSKRILIRNAGNFAFLDDRFFRLAVKDRRSNEILLAALQDLL